MSGWLGLPAGLTGDILTGVAASAGFMIGGPVGAGLAAGAVGVLASHYVDGNKNWSQNFEAGAMDGAIATIGGGVAASAEKNAGKGLFRVFRDGWTAYTPGGMSKIEASVGKDGFNLAKRRAFAIRSVTKMGKGAVVSGAAAGYVNSMNTNSSPGTPGDLSSFGISAMPYKNITHPGQPV
ncbi:hypothetical protein [Nocardia sp. NBC_01327]|uniref:hypothetical protein n=1 Tax=Nocardia sp. NBC_01327 TaxID=2903593 RepID=UPI002E167FE7|nr:hypothetical protein OG326_41750 [Nocardia sp. NBC_01327]